MAVSLFISFSGGRRYQTFWPKFAFFAVASVVGMTLFPFFNGLYQGAAPQQARLIDAEFRARMWTVWPGIVAMAYVGAWRLQKIINEKKPIR
jgi:hypothetical protein